MTVQTRYTDTFGRGFPGEVFNASSVGGNAIFSAYASTDVAVGRAVKYVSATEQQNYAEGRAVANVEGIAAPEDIVGIITKDVQALVNQNNEAYVPAKRMCTFARTNRHALIYVEADPAVAIQPGDDVWVVVATVNTPELQVGQFTNTAGAGAAVGMLQLPWKFFKGNDGAGKTAIIDLTNV